MMGLQQATQAQTQETWKEPAAAQGSAVAVVVRQLTEHVQGDSGLIGRLKEAGVVPNARVLVETSADGDVTVVVSGHENVELPHEMAHAVMVEKV